MNEIRNYIEQNKRRFLDELFGLLRIPSISALPDHKPDMYEAAHYWVKTLLDAGAQKAEIFDTAGNPVVYAERIIDKDAPTVLIYAHMDVMPVDPLHLWQSKPFEPCIREGKIFARGANDDKGQSMIQAKAFETMVQLGKMECNVKFMIEGEEEVGSVNLEQFCIEHSQLLKADIIVVSDTGMLSIDTPSITTGLRGLAYMQVEVSGPNRDLHSGIFGGAVANPANVLTKMIAQLTDEMNRISIPGFYDKVLHYSDEERSEMAKAPFDLEKYKKALEIDDIQGEAGYSSMERTGIRPSLDINGIWGGYTAEGSKTVLPSKASAKISMRLVPNQSPDEIARLFTDYFLSLAPKSVHVKVEYLHGGDPYISPRNIAAYQAASKAYEDVFGKKPIPVNSGGSIPIIATFERVLGIKTILMGFGLESDAIHSPNENFHLELFHKGIETVALFYQYFKDIQSKKE